MIKKLFTLLLLLTLASALPLPAQAASPADTVSGVVYLDANFNNIRDFWKDDIGLGGWRVFLDSGNPNGKYDEGEVFAYTNDHKIGVVKHNDGQYALTPLPAGTYRVCVDAPPGWATTVYGTECQEVILTGASTQTVVNFSYMEVPIPTEGMLMVDKVTIDLPDTISSYVIQKEGSDLAAFSLDNYTEPVTTHLLPGTYSVAETYPAYEHPEATVKFACINTQDPYTLLSPESINVVAGETVICTSSHFVGNRFNVTLFHDLSGEGMMDMDEPGLDGWKVTVYRGQTCGLAENVESTGIADANGLATVRGLSTGTYSVAVSTLSDGLHDNWYETSGNYCFNGTFDGYGQNRYYIFGFREI